MKKVSNVFFIQRAAIDVLLLNKATAIDICTYLVIAKYTDRNGYFSGVGFMTLKERLGVGQKKISESIMRLTTIEFSGQRLLYPINEWMHKENVPINEYRVGWVLGWFETEYKYHVWLNNDLVGKNGKKQKPLNYFTKASGRDDHARMLLLLYKHHNKQYSGVNYKFASLTTKIESSFKINEHVLYKSKLADYHISLSVLINLGIADKYEEARTILDDLHNNGFIRVSISAVGEHDGSGIPAKKEKKPKSGKPTKKRKLTSSQIDYLEKLKEEQIPQWVITKAKFDPKDIHNSYALFNKSNHKFITVKLRKIITDAPYPKTTFFDNLMLYPGSNPESSYQFVYRLDYKSIKKRDLELDACLAGDVEKIAVSCGLEHASRAGKFYEYYWWFNPGLKAINLIGILMPTHIPETDLTDYEKTRQMLDAMVDGKPIAFENIKSNDPTECRRKYTSNAMDIPLTPVEPEGISQSSSISYYEYLTNDDDPF
jgi:hypothetical protein